jgi:hypothetical protein
MKSLLLFLFVVISFSGYTQTEQYGSFKVADQEIIYQKIFFQDSITLDKLGDFYVKQPNVSELDMSNDEIKFKLNDLVVDYKKFQFAQVAVPSIIQTGRYSGLVTVNSKDGKYRVTMRAIQLTGDIGYKKITTKDNLTNYACRNSGTVISQDWCKPNTLGLLDKAFTDRFQYVEKGKSASGDDW